MWANYLLASKRSKHKARFYGSQLVLEDCTHETAAAAKLLQSCPTLRPHKWQPTMLLRPWDSPGKNTGVGCHFLLQCMKVKSESEVAELCPRLLTQHLLSYVL